MYFRDVVMLSFEIVIQDFIDMTERWLILYLSCKYHVNCMYVIDIYIPVAERFHVCFPQLISHFLKFVFSPLSV